MKLKPVKILLLILVVLAAIGTAVYSSRKTEISFVVGDSTETRSVFVGSVQDFPAVSTDRGYYFEGWLDASGNMHTGKSVNAGRNDVYTAVYSLVLEASDHGALIFPREDGFFHLDEPVSRGELVAMLAPFITAEIITEDNYADVMPSDAIYAAAAKFKALGLFEGDKLEPGKSVSGGELAAIFDEFKTPCAIDAGLASIGELSRIDAVKQIFAVMGIKGAGSVPTDLRGAIPDISPDSEDYALLLEAAVSHSCTLSEDGSCIWSEYSPIRSFDAGFIFIDGKLRYVHEDGSFARNESIGNISFGEDSVFTTGIAELDELVFSLLEEITDEDMDSIAKLKAAYYYVLDNSDYIKRNFYDPGTSDWAAEEAYFLLKTGYGNCYSYAASFGILARALGFDARVYSGYMGQSSDRHGWVEIEIDGENYHFDPQLEMSCRDRNEYEILFMVDEAHAHKWNYDYE